VCLPAKKLAGLLVEGQARQSDFLQKLLQAVTGQTEALQDTMARRVSPQTSEDCTLSNPTVWTSVVEGLRDSVKSDTCKAFMTNPFAEDSELIKESTQSHLDEWVSDSKFKYANQSFTCFDFFIGPCVKSYTAKPRPHLQKRGRPFAMKVFGVC